MLSRRRAVLLLATLPVLLSPALARAATARTATLYKDPDCGCCTEYGRYLGAHGFRVSVVADLAALQAVRTAHLVPAAFEGCHAVVIEGYVVEGHVPAAAIERLLAERPPIRGIALPGMPMGSPGMGGLKEGPFEIVAIDDSPEPTVFAVE